MSNFIAGFIFGVAVSLTITLIIYFSSKNKK